MRLKFFKKFFLTTAAIIFASLILITSLLCFFVSNFLIKEKQKTTSENCTAVVQAISYMSNSEIKSENTVNMFRAVSNVTDSILFITDPNGQVLLCSCENFRFGNSCKHSQNRVGVAVMEQALGNGYSGSGTLSDIFEDIHYTTGMAVKNSNGDLVGAVFSSIPNKNVRVFFETILRLFFLSALLPLLIMFFAEYYVSYRYTRPLRLMVEAANSMAEGDFSKRIPVTGNDEISELATAFNQMTDSLTQLEGTRRRFVANVSHELKTPMTTIGGFIDGIIDGTIGPDRQPYYLGIVSSEVKRLTRLIHSMLSLSKLESGEMKINKTRFNLNELLCDIVISQEQRIEERSLNIKGLDADNPLTVSADRDLIYQVIYNLVDNAIKFTNEGGELCFVTLPEPNGVRLTVRNTGAGIEAKDIPFVFERFYKGDRSRSAVKESTGLGLYIAHTIVGIHGGTIQVRSEVDRFTEFEVFLPQTEEPPAEALKANSKNERGSKNG